LLDARRPHHHPHAAPLEDGPPRESSVSVNTAMSVNTIVAGSVQNPKLLDRVRASQANTTGFPHTCRSRPAADGRPASTSGRT
jgi:hypothetical protein